MPNKPFNFKGLALILLVVLLSGFFYFLSRGKSESTQIAGAYTENDPNHPVEVYYGQPGIFNLAEMTEALKIAVWPEDKVITFPDPSMGIGSRITITRATPLELTDAKISKTYRTWAKTLRDFFAEQRIELLGQDSVEPELDTVIYYNMKVKITRVAEVEVTQKEPIDFKTTRRETMDMERGETKTIVSGKKGEKEVVYLIKRIDGEEVSRKVKSSTVLSEPTTEELLIGIAPKLVHSGPFVDFLNGAAKKYLINATALQCLMLCESNGHTDSVAAAGYVGLFQYDPGFWPSASERAGFGGAEWTDAKAQIYTTAYYISIGQGRRWPPWNIGCPRTNYQACKNK